MIKKFLLVCVSLSVGLAHAAQPAKSENDIDELKHRVGLLLGQAYPEQGTLGQEIEACCKALETLKPLYGGEYNGMYSDAGKKFSVDGTIREVRQWYTDQKARDDTACKKLQAFTQAHHGHKTALFIGRGSEEHRSGNADYPWIDEFFTKMKDIPHEQTAYVEPMDINRQSQNPNKPNSIIGFWPFPADFNGTFDIVAFDQYVTEHIGCKPGDLHNILNSLRLAITKNQQVEEVDSVIKSLATIFERNQNRVRREAIRRAYMAVKPGGTLILPRNPWHKEEQERADFAAAGITQQTGNIVLRDLSEDMQNASKNMGDRMVGWFEVTKIGQS